MALNTPVQPHRPARQFPVRTRPHKQREKTAKAEAGFGFEKRMRDVRILVLSSSATHALHPAVCPLSKAGRNGLAGASSAMDGARRGTRGEGALLAKQCFASARTPSRQRLGRTPAGGGSCRPPPAHSGLPKSRTAQSRRSALLLLLLPARGRHHVHQLLAVPLATRSTFGVTNTSSSALSLLRPRCLNRLPRNGTSPRNGTLLMLLRSVNS